MTQEKKGLRFVGTIAEFRAWLYTEALKIAHAYKEEADEGWATVRDNAEKCICNEY
jgi:hypothetical protein